MIPLQLTPTELTVETIVFWILALSILTLGLAITFIAFRGYRRNQSQPMLFIAIGFGLILLIQVVLLPIDLLLDLNQFTIRTTTQVAQVAGMLSILYALTMDP